MKLVVVTAVHQRYHLTYAFVRAMERIRDNFDVVTYAAITHNDPSIDLFLAANLPYVLQENKPVGRKFNNAVNMLRDVDFTHMMILGSDDIVSDRFIEHALQQDPTNEYDLIGVDGLWFWGMNPRRAGFGNFGYFPIKGVLGGPGKMVSRRAVEAVDFAPWPDDCGYGMDAKMMKKTRRCMREAGMQPKLKKYSILDGGGFMVDIKYEQHISSLSPIHRRAYYEEQDPNVVVRKHLSENESNYLFMLYQDTKETHERNQRRK